MREKTKRTFQVPHTYTIIFILMIIVAVMTWVVPSGTFATTEIDGREVTVAGTYEQIDKTFVDGETGKEVDLRQGPGAVLEAPIAGIMAAAEVVPSCSSSAARSRSSRPPAPSMPACAG